MDISSISGGYGGLGPAAARFEAAAMRTPGARPDHDYAVPTPGERIDGVVSTAAPQKEVAMNIDLLDQSTASQRYRIDLLA